MDFVEENRNVEGILPVLVVRISANPHKFIALLNRGSALGLNFDVTREPEWGIAGKIPRKKEGGIKPEPSKKYGPTAFCAKPLSALAP